MPQVPQSVKPSVLMPWFKAAVATGLAIDDSQVRIVAEDTDKEPEFSHEPVSAMVWLGPPASVQDSGAGRYGYFLFRHMMVSIWTRGGLDEQGSDEKALLAHWDYEDALVDYLLLKQPNLGTAPTVTPHKTLKLIEDPGVNRFYYIDAAKYKSTLGFLVQYSAPVTV